MPRRRAPGPKPGPKPARRTTRRRTRRTVHRVRRRTRRRRIIVGGAVVLMVGGAYTSYKVSEQEAQQIEQHTGKPPEELTEAEFDGAMDDLGIQDQELTPEDEAAIEVEAV